MRACVHREDGHLVNLGSLVIDIHRIHIKLEERLSVLAHADSDPIELKPAVSK